METVLRVTVLYVVILLGLRVLGKRELSQLSPIELVVLMLIPEIVSQPLAREDFSITNAIIGLCTLFSLVFISSLAAYLIPSFARMLEGTRKILIQGIKNGPPKVDVGLLDRERLSADELWGELRKAGYEDLSKVKFVVLETDGKLSFVPMDSGGNDSQRNDDRGPL